jgi:hypothetical protein
LQAHFDEHGYQVRMVKFCITEIRAGRQDRHDEIRIGKPLLDDFDTKILAILKKSPFESSHSISETLGVARSTVLLHLHDSVSFKSFHLHWVPYVWTDALRENEKSMQKRY